MRQMELKMHDVKYIPPGTIVDFGALGGCIGIAMYSRKKRAAYACHLVEPSGGDILSLENMIKNAKSKLGDTSSLEVYVAGGANSTLAPEPERKYFLKKRGDLREILKKHGFKNSKIWIRWSPENSWAELTLNVDNGKTLLQISLYSQYKEDKTLYEGDLKKAPDF